MTPATIVWTQFGLCVLVIGFAGVKLTDYGDSIADKTGMGGTWVGLVLIATVTSLPELATGITASAVALLPDIAVGDVLGSCVYNLVLLALLDLFSPKQPILARAQRQHVLSASLGVILIGVATLGLLAGQAGLSGMAGHIAWTTPVLLVIYALIIRTLHRFQEVEVEEFTEDKPDRYADTSTRSIAVRYALAALAVVAAGIWLPYVSEDISHVMGWQQSFTGTLFTALSTSIPELVVTLAALRIGAVDMAIGNVLGSNIFNIMILALDDLFYFQGPIYEAVSLGHIVSGITAMTMSAAIVAGVYFRPRLRFLNVWSWPSLALVGLFSLNTWLMFHIGAV